ncbi:hypothetical protein [Streptomyces sp. NPDC007083]|uniref:hypothetical protein n=1 Tax=Streptomyces sp. NPDC007083 TaxID=3156913 RepID=UPI003411DF29
MSDVYSPVPELNMLKEFADNVGGFFDPDGFEFFEYGRDIDWFCGDAPDSYLERLLPFAYATGSGSFYALWRCDDRADLATLPVIFFGDEGELSVAASNLRELLQLLTLKDEYDDELNVEIAPERQQYLEWLDRNFGLPALESFDNVGGEELKVCTRRFGEWLLEFATGDLRETVCVELHLEDLA